MSEFTSTIYSPDRLVGNNAHLLVGQKVTILTGQVLSRGALLGKITASGKHILSLSAAGDGSQTADLILAEDVDATAADVVTLAYSRGDFDESAVTYGTGHTADSVRETLRGKGIVLVPSVSA
jgi:hypothetical protein